MVSKDVTADGPTRRPLSTRENDKFVQDYFAQSRLHFIGFFRARYESMMAAVASRLGIEPTILLQPKNTRKQGKHRQSIIAHVDIDCFFASVAVVKNPHLAGKPIAVCHGSDSSSVVREGRGGEISSASYEARKRGVHAGMLFGEAQRLCPKLIAVPYDFKLYEDVSIQLYTLFYRIPGVVVEAISVDEAYLDLTSSLKHISEADILMRKLRDRIFSDTGCTASAGVGTNKLIARLATKRAKPNGQLCVIEDDSSSFISTMELRDIPGIGWKTRKRLQQLKVSSVTELQNISIDLLQREFGHTQGKLFYDAARGRDHREVESLKPRKSIGADCGWGVRFENNEDKKVEKFICDMADEVTSRLKEAGAIGRRVSYKVLRKQKNASAAYKFLGHGSCDVYTKFAELRALSDLRSLCLRLHAEIRCPNNEFRGIGIKITDITFHSLTSKPAGIRPGAIESYFNQSKPEPQCGQHSLGDQSLESRGWKIGESNGLHVAASAAEDVSNVTNVTDGVAKRVIEKDCCALENDKFRTRIHRTAGHARSQAEEHSNIPDKWDQEVFSALPESLREELLREKKLGKEGSGTGLRLNTVIRKRSPRKRPQTALTKMLKAWSRRGPKSSDE